MQNFATALPSFAASLSCYTRIQEFLAAGGQHDRKNTEEFSVQDHLSSHEPHLISIELEVANPHTSSAVKLGDIIRVNDASFSFPSTTSPILRNISVRITSDTLTLVTGPTGSGKTAFLEALLGELCRTKGNVTLNATGIGYCAQNPWLPNATIRDIILASNEYDDEWYRKTLHVCMLDQDLERLPDEDKTVVGSKGTKLSGGQKQRVVSALLPNGKQSGPNSSICYRLLHERSIRRGSFCYLMIFSVGLMLPQSTFLRRECWAPMVSALNTMSPWY
jgi:ATP-binding cassette subfamily C (CFTR/MRP) protein 1